MFNLLRICKINLSYRLIQGFLVVPQILEAHPDPVVLLYLEVLAFHSYLEVPTHHEDPEIL